DRLVGLVIKQDSGRHFPVVVALGEQRGQCRLLHVGLDIELGELSEFLEHPRERLGEDRIDIGFAAAAAGEERSQGLVERLGHLVLAHLPHFPCLPSGSGYKKRWAPTWRAPRFSSSPGSAAGPAVLAHRYS